MQDFSKKNQSIQSDKLDNSVNDIAIIGIACRFPDASDYLTFWKNLINNKNSISEITKDRWDIKQYYSTDPHQPNKSISKWGGLINNIDCFDAPFFNISPYEAIIMDPQQRLLLEETWHCIEDAGIALNELQQKNTAVFVGVMAIDYHQKLLSPSTETNAIVIPKKKIL
jgi:acyl transferase domain-containing protein